MSLISLEQFKQQQFIDLAEKIIRQPEHYLQFESVSDVYRAKWLDDFPVGTTWQVTGLDDGAEQFCLLIIYKNYQLMIDWRGGDQFVTQLKYPNQTIK